MSRKDDHSGVEYVDPSIPERTHQIVARVPLRVVPLATGCAGVRSVQKRGEIQEAVYGVTWCICPSWSGREAETRLDTRRCSPVANGAMMVVRFRIWRGWILLIFWAVRVSSLRRHETGSDLDETRLIRPGHEFSNVNKTHALPHPTLA